MKKILNVFFVTLGVIFFIILCGLAYIWFADPFNIRPFVSVLTAESTEASISLKGGSIKDKNPVLSSEQEAALESIGINPENLPSTITPEMEACFTAKLGSARVAEIKAGASPTAVEVFTTRECYE